MLVLHKYGIIGGGFLLPPQEDVVNMTHDKTPGKTGDNNGPNKNWELNSPKMIVFIEHDIADHTFILLSKEEGHKFWAYVVTIIYGHVKKVTQ